MGVDQQVYRYRWEGWEFVEDIRHILFVRYISHMLQCSLSFYNS